MFDPDFEDTFILCEKAISGYINKTNIDHGFDWEAGNFAQDASKIALIHSELSEVLEALRKPDESDKLPGMSNLAEELADVYIRLAHFAWKHDINLGDAILRKMEYNEGREYMHGKRG